MRKLVLIFSIIYYISFYTYAQNVHPSIWVTVNDTAQIWNNIRNYEWAANLYDDLLNRVDGAVAIHKNDPEYYTSRIPRTWGSCPNYTSIAGGGGSIPPVYSNADLAEKPTLHRVVDISSPVSDNGNRIFSISLDDIPPFNDTDLFGMVCQTDGGYEFASYIGRELRMIHTNFMELGVDCGIAYYLTGNEDYAQLAADILSGYVEALAPMKPGYDLTGGGIVFPWDHLKGSRVMQRLPLIYDFIYPFIKDAATTVYQPVSEGIGNRIPFNFDDAQQYFINQVNTVMTRGIRGKNNWPLFESEVAYYCVICISDPTIQNELFNNLFTNGAERQTSTKVLLDNFVDGIWPESGTYSIAVHEKMLRILNIIDRWQPELNVLENNKFLLDGALNFAAMEFPNGEFIRFGDAHRTLGALKWYYREALATSKQKNYTVHEEQFGKLLKAEYPGGYLPSWTNPYIPYTVPLELLWGVDLGKYALEEIDYQTTIKASGQGIVVQRNYFTDNITRDGLMCFTGGAAYVHGHASGIDMELYGKGFVMGVEGGEGSDRSSDLHANYLRVYAAHNTVIVNGSSRGNGGWQNIAQDKTQTIAMEPLVGEKPISETFSFTRQFLDDNINNCDQQRTVSIIRTSPETGYYIDIFRSVSNVENNFHDYIYHNIGDNLKLLNVLDEELTTTPNNTYYATDIGDTYEQPGWKFFENVQTASLTDTLVKARFEMAADHRFMHSFIPAGDDLEISKAVGPPTIGAPSKYANTKTPVMIIRKNGEAWDHPFVVVYEPSLKEKPSVKSVHPIYARGKVVGTEVRSVVPFTSVTDYILTNEEEEETFILPGVNISFEGKFGIVRVEKRDSTERITLYIGDGKSISFRSDTLIANEKNQGLKIVGALNAVAMPESEAILIEIEAEDYNDGGEGVAYHDYDAGNSGGVYRDDDVDIEAYEEASNGYAVVNFKGAEWLKYTFESDTSCNYEMNYVAACRNNDAAKVKLYLNDSLLTGVAVPVNRTFDWGTFESNIMPDSVFLEKGTHVLKITQATSLSHNPDKVVFKHGETVHFEDTITTNIRPVDNPDTGYFLSDVVELQVTSENGTVTVSPDNDLFLKGEEITLEANPTEGYQFNGWSGDVTSIENPTTFMIDSNMNVSANFILETSVSDPERQQVVKIFPNPTTGLLTVQAPSTKFETYTIWSISGRVVYEGFISEQFSIDMKGNPRGVYFLKLTDDREVAWKKIILE